MLARAINGSAAFFPTLGGGFALVFLHCLLAMFAFYSQGFNQLVKAKRKCWLKMDIGFHRVYAATKSQKRTCWKRFGSKGRSCRLNQCRRRRSSATAK
jgi:hypothetical protein